MPTGASDLIAWWLMDGSLLDETDNLFDAVTYNSPTFTNGPDNWMEALKLDGKNFVQLPYEIASSDELTVTMWVKWRNSSDKMQHLFSFGSGTGNHISMTASNQNNLMSLTVKKGTTVQTLSCKTALATSQWKHVAVSIKRGNTAIYVDGQQAAQSTRITFRPRDIRPILNYIGRSQSLADPLLKAYVADVRIYNKALDEDEVVAVKDNELTAIGDVPDDASSDEDASCYTLDGRKLAKPHRGIMVTKQRKVLMK